MEGLIPKYEPPNLKIFEFGAKTKLEVELEFNGFAIWKLDILDFGGPKKYNRWT